MDELWGGATASWEVKSHAPGPAGSLPLTPEMLRERPLGDVFALSHNVGMGWDPKALTGPQYVLLSTQGGIRAEDGSPIALGYHTGHYEVGLLVAEAARAMKAGGAIPFAGFVSDPCDGRTQGTVGMFDSLPYRNDAAVVLGRLIRSLPTRRGVLGVATCDKGLPAMMMALAAARELPVILVPGGVTLPPTVGEDTAKVQTIGARYSRGMISLDQAALEGCRVCASPGGGCQFLGTAASSQVVAEALGLALPHTALAPSGQPIWLDAARRSALALMSMKHRSRDLLTDASIKNAMTVHAAFGGSTNLILHLPAIAFMAGLRRPSVEDWIAINRRIPRMVDALPNGPMNHPTVRVFMAGGVPEVMLHLRAMGLLELGVPTAGGKTLGEVLSWWEKSPRRADLRRQLRERDGVDPDTVIYSPERARAAGMTPTVCFPRGNLAPEGSVVKSTSIDPRVVDADGVYRKTGPARVFTREREAVAALKEGRVATGSVIVLCCRGPMGTGMEETYQITSALRDLPGGREMALVTDARFSGVSTGPCIGHVGPEALAGGPIGKVLDGDVIRIVIDRNTLKGSVDLMGPGGPADDLVAKRPMRPDLAPDPALPPETRLWAALQQAGGGIWGGCVYDTDAILEAMASGPKAQVQSPTSSRR